MRLAGEEYEGQARRLRQTARSPRATLCGEKKRDDSVVMTRIRSAPPRRSLEGRQDQVNVEPLMGCHSLHANKVFSIKPFASSGL